MVWESWVAGTTTTKIPNPRFRFNLGLMISMLAITSKRPTPKGIRESPS
jgi:hypothetical protein